MAESLQSGLATPDTSHHPPRKLLNWISGTSPKSLCTMGSDRSHGKRRAQTRSVGHHGSEGAAGAAVRKSPRHNSRRKTEISPPDACARGPRLLPSHCSALLTTQFPPRSPTWLLQLRPSLLVSRQLQEEKGRVDTVFTFTGTSRK